MRSATQPEAQIDDRKGLRTGDELDKRFPVAMALYGVLALLAWFLMDAGKVMVFGRPVEMRLVPLVVIGGLALRTVLARQADRIRRDGEKDGSGDKPPSF
jgi:hypothetical protein